MMQTDWETLCDITDDLMATGRFPARHEAMLEAQRQNPHLDRTPPGMKPVRPTTHGAIGGGNAEQQLHAAATRIAAARHITFAAAYVQALVENPRLYTLYLEQHPRQTGGGRG